MPYNKNYKKGLKKKNYRKKYLRKWKRNNTRSMFSKTPATPLGKTFKYKTRYYDRALTLTTGTSGTAAYHIFSVNGLYDPDITGVGHQPLGFDELMNMYDHYTVIGARIRVDFQNTSAVDAVQCGILVDDGTTPSTDTRVIIENGLGKNMILGPEGQANSSRSMVLNCNPSKRLGISKPLAEKDIRGSSSANPTEQCYFGIWAADPAGSSGHTVNFNVTIEYVSILTEPKQMSLS